MESQKNTHSAVIVLINSIKVQSGTLYYLAIFLSLSFSCLLSLQQSPQRKCTDVLSLTIAPSNPLIRSPDFPSHQTISTATQRLTKRPQALTGHQSAMAHSWRVIRAILSFDLWELPLRGLSLCNILTLWQYASCYILNNSTRWTESRWGRERQIGREWGWDRDPGSISWALPDRRDRDRSEDVSVTGDTVKV